jgi:hypothetical protein
VSSSPDRHSDLVVFGIFKGGFDVFKTLSIDDTLRAHALRRHKTACCILIAVDVVSLISWGVLLASDTGDMRHGVEFGSSVMY